MANNPVANLLRAPELKEKLLFTLFILLIYRVGAHITVPGLDVNALRLAFGNLQIWKPVGLILLIAPHVFGAPHAPAGAVGTAPPELASHFVVTTLFSGAMMWLALGIAMAYMLQRIDARQTVTQPVT